jgi:hypothetical protein
MDARSRSPEDDGEGSAVDENEAKKQANRECGSVVKRQAD